MTKKYEFTGLTKEHKDVVLNQIRAVKDFGDVKSGDIGGWIQSESNLSHDGNCWVYEDAMVYENAWIYGNAKVYENAKVFGNAMVSVNAMVAGNAIVSGDAMVSGDAWVSGNTFLN